ncbi:hypothetical protein BSL78_25514 [Apostichopus japonicus]|uniref:Uncharacterized protein n=1 Tax=Stichopus japonicus TaxID=307972 RepID=A0A2G8JPI6_STIJA|nr:hypothetical protein BSL78_25514 [Apostichopus japonicus]
MEEGHAARDEEAKSSSSSRTSGTSVTSSVRLREAKVKQELARRKKEQAIKERELRRKQMEINERIEDMKLDNEVENADVEAAMWQEEWMSKPTVPPADPYHRLSNNELTCPKEPKSGARIGETIFRRLSLDLTRRYIPKFSGDPIDYWSFMNSFDVNVARRLGDDRTTLSYLIQFCTGKAHEAIENCILLDPTMGYKRAREILYDQFGCSHVVAQAHIYKVINRSPLRSNDADSLWDLARDMRRCQMTLTQMCYTADMSTTDNLLKIQELLPVHLQSKWAGMAHGLMENKIRPNFSHMTEFVEEQAKISSNVYGKQVGKSQKLLKSGTPPRKYKETRATFATYEGTNGLAKGKVCQLCKGEHDLEECQDFTQKPL